MDPKIKLLSAARPGSWAKGRLAMMHEDAATIHTETSNLRLLPAQLCCISFGSTLSSRNRRPSRCSRCSLNFTGRGEARQGCTWKQFVLPFEGSDVSLAFACTVSLPCF